MKNDLESNMNGLDDERFSVRHLSRNALRDICDNSKDEDIKNENFILQAIEVKIFKEEDDKKNIKQRYNYSLNIIIKL